MKLHPGKAVHVVDLRLRISNLKFRNYDEKKLSSTTKAKNPNHQNDPNLGLAAKQQKSNQTLVSLKRKNMEESPGMTISRVYQF